MWDLLEKPVEAGRPKTFEELQQAYGFVLYRTAARKAEKAKLEITELRDYAVIFQGGRRLGTLDRRLAESALDVTLAGDAPLDILVENMGRINFGPRLLEDHKGITRTVTLDGAELAGWSMYRLPLSGLKGLRFANGTLPDRLSTARASTLLRPATRSSTCAAGAKASSG